ncbi:glutathione transferase GstA [Arenimonas fontis]|uniref:Glutathione transferase GstA n=1 Tax=Arenimonas fontis TaxID=2608255 RepID=A0A5B2ZDI4_9GAMM|nr:glutathione transferase GstA [Arenimonas fontis]KAA2286079.1 glutathione transferase GstA [Arenimonas fontis]
MKLYYLPGACSLAPHIALREAGLAFDLVRVGRDRKTEQGEDYLAINPFGYVPALQLDDGRVLTENIAILQYIADLEPAAGLAPARDGFERYRLQSALAFVSTELHKSLGLLFNPALDEAGRKLVGERARARLDTLERSWNGRTWLHGQRYGVADIYQFVVLRWLAHFGMDLREWPSLAAHSARVAERPAVRAALAAEGLA